MTASSDRAPGGLTRRGFAGLSAAAALLPGVLRPTPSSADETAWRHGLSLLGTPKYPAGFPHFAYVRPDAPSGGAVRFGEQGTFDNFNLFVSGVRGQLEGGIGTLVYDTLMTSALDEVATSYGLIAEAVRYPQDRSAVTYRLRRQARFQDGTPISPDDVRFSFDTLKSASPFYAFYYHNVAMAEVTGEDEITFRFSQTGNRELPQIVGEIPILPKHWWTGKSPDGAPRDPTKTMLEPPLGSGPYRLTSFDAGRFAVYERVADYWGRDLPVNRGRNNFDTIRFEYFRDSTVLFEGFKGDRYDFRSEGSARLWATGYGFPAVAERRVVREEFPIRATGIMQAFAFNLRRPKLADQRLRRAFNLAFDFEEANRSLFYGLYRRIDSYFFGTELASSGLPQGQELELLRSLGDKVPQRIFTNPYTNPVNGTSESLRANLHEAVRLLHSAGYAFKERRLVDRAGVPLRVEILGYDQNDERVVLPYKANLERIGIRVDLRIVDAAQYENRMRSYDFDITTASWPESMSPGNEQREFWGSAAADRPGSRNMVGIQDPAVDALIDKIVYATDRDGLVAATRALDRVLLAQDFVVPQWASSVTRTARWNRFGRPETLPEYGGSGFPAIWWHDEALARKTGAPA